MGLFDFLKSKNKDDVQPPIEENVAEKIVEEDVFADVQGCSKEVINGNL